MRFINILRLSFFVFGFLFFNVKVFNNYKIITPLDRDIMEANAVIRKVHDSGRLSPKAVIGLAGVMQQNVVAREELRQQSRKPLTSVPIDFVARTLLVENTGEASVKEVDKLLSGLADNPNALAKVTSQAKARGPVQFTKKPYEEISRRHPEIRLAKDFKKGVSNNINAFKALHGLVYEDKKCLKINNMQSEKNRNAIASAYNAGCARGKLVKAGKHHQLPEETKGYLKKHENLAKIF